MMMRITNLCHKTGWLLLLACIISISCNRQADTYTEAVAIPVSAEEVELGSIEQYITTSGTVYPVQKAESNTAIEGRYMLQVNRRTGKHYQLGDMVDSGEVIIRIKNEEHVNNVRIDAVELNLDNAERTYQKQQSLYEKGGVTLSELKNAESDFISARYAYENARLNLEKMNIPAAFSGVIVGLPYHTQGTRIASGRMVLELMNYRKLYFGINLPEKDMDEVSINQEVRVQNYSYPEDTFYARLSQLAPVIDPDTRSFQGRVQVDNPDLKLRPGMFVRAEIITARSDSTIVISKDYVVSKRNDKVVFVVDRSTAYERDLTFGLENPDKMEILSGLKVGDRLVVKGFETLSNRAKVNVVKN